MTVEWVVGRGCTAQLEGSPEPCLALVQLTSLCGDGDVIDFEIVTNELTEQATHGRIAKKKRKGSVEWWLTSRMCNAATLPAQFIYLHTDGQAKRSR